MINLNEAKFNGAENAPKIFNDGEAGEVIVTVRVEKKKADDHPKGPDYKVFWVKEDREINTGFYYLDSTHPKYEANLGINGRMLKDIVKALYGENVALPSGDTYKEVLDQCMQLIAGKPNTQVKIGVDYGTVKRPSKKGYLQLKNSFPFITGDLTKAIPFNWNYDLQHRPAPDAEATTTAKAEEDAPW